MNYYALPLVSSTIVVAEYDASMYVCMYVCMHSIWCIEFIDFNSILSIHHRIKISSSSS
jgi:hypothetical protein